jgi:hypothetical protein
VILEKKRKQRQMRDLRMNSAPASDSENRSKKNRFNKCTKQEMKNNVHGQLGNRSSKRTVTVEVSGSFDTLR